MAGGPAASSPSTEEVSTAAAELTSLRARLAAAEADLTQTRSDLSSTRADLSAARDGAPADSVGRGGAPAGACAGGGTAVDSGPAASPADGTRGPLAPGACAPAALGGGGATGPPAPAGPAGDAPLDGAALGDYVRFDDDAAASGYGDEWDGPSRQEGGGARGSGRGPRLDLDMAAAYDDGFDFYRSYTPTEWLQGFDIPRSVLRADGMPMPLTPADPVHTATFSVGSRDELEARHWYCSLAWTEQLFNDALAARHSSGATVPLLRELLEHVVGASRRIYALGVSRYDYLALRQSEPNLADAFSHADAVPRNSLRGDGARRFLSRVARAETSASAKVGAAERGFSYPQRVNRAAAPSQAARARSPARQGRGGGGGGRGGGGGGGRGGRGGGGGGRGRGGGRA